MKEHIDLMSRLISRVLLKSEIHCYISQCMTHASAEIISGYFLGSKTFKNPDYKVIEIVTKIGSFVTAPC